jgi:hypothetical protein
VPVLDNIWNIDDLDAKFSYDPDNIRIEYCNIACGADTRFAVSGLLRDFHTRPQFQVEAFVKNLHHGPDSTTPNTFVYSRALLENLPIEVGRKFLEEYRPRAQRIPCIFLVETISNTSFFRLE